MVCTVLAVVGGVFAAKALSRGFGHRRGHCHGGHEGHRHGPWGIGRSRFLRRIFQKLDTTPGQEKVIREAINEFRESARAVRPVGSDLRSDLAGVMRQPELSDDAFASLDSKGDEAISRVRSAFRNALRKIHDVLDGAQREKLAEMLETKWGFAAPFAGGPYR